MCSDYENKGDNARTRTSAFKHLPVVILFIFGEYSRFLFNITSQVISTKKEIILPWIYMKKL